MRFVSWRILFYYIAIFIIFNESFLSSLSYIYVLKFNRLINLSMDIFAILLFVSAQYTYHSSENRGYDSITKILVGGMLVFYFVGMFFYPVYSTQTSRFIIVILFFLVGYRDDRWIDIFLKLSFLFGIVYIVTTIWFSIDKTIYYNYFAFKMYPNYLNYDYINSSGMAGITDHYSTNGMMLANISILLFAFLLSRMNKISITYLALFSASIMALILCGKRAHFAFVIVACFLAYLIIDYKKKGKISKTFLVIFLLFIIYNLLATYSPEFQSLISRFDNMTESRTTLIRYQLWASSIVGFYKNLIFGVGWPGGRELTLNVMGGNQDVHNEFIQILCETGIVGTVFFLGFMVLACIAAIKLLLLCSDNDLTYNKRTRCCVIFSFAYQIFFIIYCITASPLHQAYTSNCYYFAAFLSIYIYINRNKYFIR